MICPTHTQLPLAGLVEKSVDCPALGKSSELPERTVGSEDDPKEASKERRRLYARDHYQRNKERIKSDRIKKGRSGSDYWKKYNAEHLAVRRLARRKSYRLHREARLAADRKLYLKNRERIIATNATYARKNRSKVREYRRGYFYRRKKEDPLFALRCRLSDRVTKCLKRIGVPRANRTMEMVGCTVEFLKAHIEKQFLPGMSWELFMAGKIHLDHVKPFAAFDLTDPVQQLAAIHYTNLKPEWPTVNLRKHSRWNGKVWRQRDHAAHSLSIVSNSDIASASGSPAFSGRGLPPAPAGGSDSS